ncbi:ATP-binding cassette sub- B member 6, mitochondrial [Tieghemiomyces parasiticus]|uniref:ATP-binding cassette sub- B member 6, mitochondrial n=1 Tax=Tieghemiomyces parasiticus TaxID=78921 RepID=A0A9W8A7C6_9FUNG|nr:ATP-binding cassette sub- B member 6, mitochondrial [Tieghemiomyces parasiticus]
MAMGRLQITDVAYFATYFSETYKPLTIVMDLVTRLHYEHRSGSELLTLIDAPVDAPEPPHVEPWKTTGGAIEFKNVCFSYSEAGKQRAVLRDITFKVPAETTTAIVGKTGAGKSTLFLLIMRLYDVCSGSITVNGTDVRQVKATDLRQNMVLVQQEGTLFDHTLDFNIKYGSARDGLRATTEKVSQAARRARIHDRIVTLPKGYDTVMYEDGFDLSGGENQRVRIARGLIHESQILLLDETTSALDILTEREVQSELIRGTKGKTCLMIAHRLPTVIHADQILVLDEGTIVERGSFAELMALPDGVFRKMWQAQLKQRVVDLTT